MASATTDMGHQGRNDGSWAAGNPQAQIDFSYRGVHVTAQVTKAIIAAFYGRYPAYSYFDGIAASSHHRHRHGPHPSVFPYPTVARYDGTGSIDDAANFVAYTPRNPVRDDDHWIGEGLYSHGYQTWPKAVDGRLVLSRR